MAGCRPLTYIEERLLLCVVRRLLTRNRALVTTQWFTGFRVGEVLSVTASSVWPDGRSSFDESTTSGETSAVPPLLTTVNDAGAEEERFIFPYATFGGGGGE